MGGVVTTFCNETNIPLITSLSILIPFYSTHNLQPGRCVSYETGRVWFTASAELDKDDYAGLGNIFIPVSETEAGGISDVVHGHTWSTEAVFTKMTSEEAIKVMSSPDDVIKRDPASVKEAYREASKKLHVSGKGIYAGNKKVTITGGPKRVVYKIHPALIPRRITIVPAQFEPLKMTITDLNK